MNAMLPREEYIEQAYFFRTLRERIGEGIPTQEILSRLHEEILSTTRLPLAIEFLAQELRFRGELHPAMVQVEHYFAPFQAFVIGQAENDESRFDMPTALLVLEREAEYLSGEPTPQGLFVYQFESLSRNRLGYDRGLLAISRDPAYDEPWRKWIQRVRTSIGTVEFAELLYIRSEHYVQARRRRGDDRPSRHPVLFDEKEGKIAKANRGKDPLFLFASLQRQLGYPAVPRPPRPEEDVNVVQELQRRVEKLESRVKVLEGDVKGDLDLSQYYTKPDSEQNEAPSEQ